MQSVSVVDSISFATFWLPSEHDNVIKACSQSASSIQYLLLISGYPQNMTMLLKHAVSQRRRFNIFC